MDELTCGVQQVGNFSTTTEDAPSLINLQNTLVLVNVLSLPCLFIREKRENNHQLTKTNHML
jgi:hypothetical protein